MAVKRNKLIKTLKKLVAELNKEIVINRAYLFGSYAKGHPGRWSDVDLALVSARFSGTRFYDSKKLIPLLKSAPSNIEVHPFKNKDFSSSNLFAREIMKSGIRIK